MLSISDIGESTSLTTPAGYDGNIGFRSKQKLSYFFTFKNTSHNVISFVKKHPNATKPLASYSGNLMTAGAYYEVEIGRSGNTLRLTVDGENSLNTTDKTALSNGKTGFRIGRTAGFKNGYFVINLHIYMK